MKGKQAVLIISGYNVRAVIAFCRWAVKRGIDFHIIASGVADPILQTRYKERVAFVRSSPVLEINEFAEWARSLSHRHGYGRMLVLPSTEYLNRFLLARRDALEDASCHIPLADEALYIEISDKLSFARLCSSYGLDIPQEFIGLPKDLPFVAKPRKYLSASGRQLVPQLVDTRDDLEGFLRDETPEEYFFQEHVTGKSLYLLACIRKDGDDVLFSQENLMQQTHGGSVILARRSDFHRTPIAQEYVRMLHDLSFAGLIMIEIRQNEVTGKHCMIEANPRLWGPIQFAVDNDIDLFGAVLADHGFKTDPPSTPSKGCDFYFWSGGIRPAAHPVRFHNYSCDQFVLDLPSLWRHDLFFRRDTLELHFHELGTGPFHDF